MYEFRWPTRTLVGSGLIERVGGYVPPPDTAGRLLLVAPQEVWARPLAQRIAAQLREVGWERVETFAEVEPNVDSNPRPVAEADVVAVAQESFKIE